MNKKIECTIWLYDKKMDEIGVKTEDIPARLSVAPNEIAFCRERSEDGDKICPKTSIIGLKSGETFIIDKSFDEINNLIG